MYYAQEIVSIPIREGKVKANAARKGTLQAEPPCHVTFQTALFTAARGGGCWGFIGLLTACEACQSSPIDQPASKGKWKDRNYQVI